MKRIFSFIVLVLVGGFAFMSFADDNQIKELKVAAERGDDVAQTNLGLYYEMGYGVKKNPDKAIYWWKKAAEQGNVVAQFNLGNCYYSGKGVKKNLKKTVYWWEKAANGGDMLCLSII